METPNVIVLINGIRDKANQYIIDELKTRGVGDIVPSHADILTNLYRHGPMSMSHLADRIKRKKNTLTVLVHKLVKLGYITKGEDPNDQRVNIISLTHRALEIQKDFQEISEDLFQKAYQGITEAEKSQLNQLLQKIHQNF